MPSDLVCPGHSYYGRMNDKLDRFLDSFEKKNDDPILARFLNEVLDDMEGESDYINHLELESLQHQIHHRNFVAFINKNAHIIDMGKRTLKQLKKIKTNSLKKPKFYDNSKVSKEIKLKFINEVIFKKR